MINKKMFLVKENIDAKKVPTRNGYGKGLVQLGKKNKNIVVLCADLSDSTRSSYFKKEFPKRFIQVGVAEQNLVTIASGLVAVGKIPFAASYAVFSPGRNWEQIRTTICYNNQPVKIIGSHTGVTVGADGATHQALEDIALMRVLPNMEVVVPCDAVEAKKATIAIGKTPQPSYLRLTRNATDVITTSKTPFKIGKAEIFKQGKDVAIIGCGPLLIKAMQVSKELERKGIKAMVVNCHTIKPLDKKTILSIAKKTKAIVTVEEHQITGGLGGAIAEFLSENYPIPIIKVGMKDKFGESGSPEELLNKFKLNKKGIVKAVEKVLKLKNRIK